MSHYSTSSCIYVQYIACVKTRIFPVCFFFLIFAHSFCNLSDSQTVRFSHSWHLNQVHHTYTHSSWCVVHGDSAHLWAEHLSHPQTTTGPLIHSSCIPPSVCTSLICPTGSGLGHYTASLLSMFLVWFSKANCCRSQTILYLMMQMLLLSLLHSHSLIHCLVSKIIWKNTEKVFNWIYFIISRRFDVFNQVVS